jgi:hypothetical protein
MEAHPRKYANGPVIVLAIIVILALYVLSIGPVVWYFGEFPDRPLVTGFYAPLLWLGDCHPWFYEFLDHYAAWWQ